MREKYEGQGLEWFFRIVFALAAVTLLAFVIGILRVMWKWLT